MEIEYDEVRCMLTRIQIVLSSERLDDKQARKYALEDVISMLNDIYHAKERFERIKKEQSK
ncbi:MAG: hypothetical protein IJW08_06005 [Lentisphaeria bacterium]|nr:hypothetical protein [Lentisphaeria bacterium]